MCSYYNVYLFVCLFVCVQFVSYQALDPEDYRGQAHDCPLDPVAVKIMLGKANILSAIADVSAGLFVCIE